MLVFNLFLILTGIVFFSVFSIFVYDRYFNTKNCVMANFPLLGRFRYLAHELRPFVRQYFFKDDEFYPRNLIEWILSVSKGKTGYFSFDKFDTTNKLDSDENRMVHSSTPVNIDEMKIEYPIIGEKRKNPIKPKSYIYRSAMSLGAIGFEGTYAMAKGVANSGSLFNTGEGGFSIHHLPNLKFNYQEYLSYIKVSKFYKLFYNSLLSKRLKNNFIDFLGKFYLPKGKRDLYLFCYEKFVFYKIDWEKPLSVFPKKVEKEFGQIIFQIGSGLYGLRKKSKDHSKLDLDFKRFSKTMSFCVGCEIKLAQGAKQSGGILKANKNTKAVSEIRGVHEGIDLISQNRFPFYEKNKEKEFFEFIEKLSKESNSKPVGVKLIISDESSIEKISKEIKKTNGKIGPDFITIDGGDGGSGTAPYSLGTLFGKKAIPALKVVVDNLEKHKSRDKVKIFLSSKLYTANYSARALALGADLVGTARGIMLSAGCIRSGKCSGENGPCPVGLATMKKNKRKSYAMVIEEKAKSVTRYIKAHNKDLVSVSSICGVYSPNKLNKNHIYKLQKNI